MRILTTPYDLPDLRGRQEYIEVFRGLKSESDPRGIGFAFHRAGAEIAENSHFWMGTSLAVFIGSDHKISIKHKIKNL